MTNYEFCAQWIHDQKPEKSIRVLDFGCGDGRIIKELQKRNINAFGGDIFYEGGNYSKSIDTGLYNSGVVKRMNGNSIPFDLASFDFIINNQVMEYVENLDIVLSEIHRVLKPGGVVLSLFPDIAVWREGHCGIPFIHCFPKYSRTRVYYATGLRFIGLGYHKGNKSIMSWSQDFCDWLDKWTHYRPRKEIDSVYNKYFYDIRNIEDYWLQKRLRGRKYLVSWLPTSVQKIVVNKFGGMVFIAHKPV